MKAELAERLKENGSELVLLSSAEELDAFLARGPWSEIIHEGTASFMLGDALLAETGSVVISARHGESRRAVFLAEKQHVLVAEENIFADLASWLSADARPWQQRCGRAVTLVCGPSRTADIEKQLVLGAHGPSELVIAVAPRDLIADRFGKDSV